VCWLDLPVEQLDVMLKHYCECKSAKPDTTSAVLLVPARAGSHTHMLRGMQRLMVFNRRNSMYETADGQSLHLDKDKVALYYDPPKAAAMLTAVQGSAHRLTMTFDGTANQANAALTLDSAASDQFVSTSWLQRNGVTYATGTETPIVLADGHTATATGVVTLRLRVGALRDKVQCHVLDMPGFDIILGDDWLRSRRVHMDFGTKSAYVYKGQHRVVLRQQKQDLQLGGGETSHKPHKPNKDPMLLSALQVKRLFRSSGRHLLVQVTTSTADRYRLAAMNQANADGLVPEANLQAILVEYKDVFEELPDELPPVRNIAHVIPLEPGARPVYKPLYRLTQAEKAEVERQVADLLRKGYIEPSQSPWGAPVLFVPKKDGGLRMCIDYRALNKLTVKNRYPLPRIEDLLDQLQGAKVFSGLDLASGYWQIRIEDDDVPKTAFRTHVGHYQWRVLSFGLTNCPSTFQQVMNDVFREYLNKFVIIYLDDILIYSSDAVQHEQHLRLVLQKLREHKLYCRSHKCHFNQAELEYLGHVVGRDGVRVDPRKVKVVQDWPVPKDVHQLRSFLGLANYVRRFIQAYSSLTRPLTDLLKATANVARDWGQKAQSAFEGVKFALTHAPVLVLPDFKAALEDKPFEVIADACGTGIGAVLLQGGHPIAFESRKFTPAELNYDTSQKELLATIHALRTWRCYLAGVPFVLVTDHHPNTAFETKVDLSPRMTRWLNLLSEYSHMKWEYRPGRTNVADPLSRMPGAVVAALSLAVSTRYGGNRRPVMERPHPADVAEQQAAYDALLQHRPVVTERTRSVQQQPRKKRHVTFAPPPAAEPAVEPVTSAEKPVEGPDLVETDAVYDKLVADFVSGYKRDPWFAAEANTATLLYRHGLYWKRLLDGTEVLVVPDMHGLRKRCMAECHDHRYAGHVGMHKTWRLLQRTFWWPAMRSDVERFVGTCVPCQRNKSSTQAPAGLLQPIPVPGRRWEVVTLDLITGLPATEGGNDAIAVFVDKLTKMVRLVACQETDGAQEVANHFVDAVFRSHGVPKTLLTDRDPRFTSNLFREISKLLGVKQAMSTAFHPQTDGQTERVNRVVEEMLRHFVQPRLDDWDQHLAMVEFAINNAYQESTGNTPFFLNYGQHPLTPVSVKHDSAVPAAVQFTLGVRAAGS
jgi:transposase InsO family protein